VNKKTLVVQSNRLVEAKYRLSVEEQKIVKILISQIQKDDKDFQDYEFHVKELAELLGMKHKDPYGVLQKITERLMTRVLKFYNPETQTLLQASWLSSALYKKGEGTVSLRFDPYLKPLLLQLQSYFTKYELGQVMQFKGQYTIRFYEFRKSFLGRRKKEVTFTLKELRDVLGLKKEEYKEFFNFKNRVLEPARIELLEKAGQSFTWEPIKQGRGGKITSVRFVFDGEVEESADENKEEPEERQQALSLAVDQEPEPKEKAMQSVLSDEAQAVFDELLGLGVGEKMARVMVEKYSAEQIREKIKIMNNKKDVENRAGFVVSAIREDWKDEKAERERLAQEAKRKHEKVAMDERELARRKDKYEKKKREMVALRFLELPEEQQQGFKNEFLALQPYLMSKLYRVKGFDINSGHFNAFMSEKFGMAKFADLENTE
jgi:plasmid replication initiation protein